MSRLVPMIAVLAVVWAALVHPERLVYTLSGFAAGVAFTSSLPWFVRWGQQIAKDTEGTGGPASHPFRRARPEDMPPASKGVRIPIDVDPNAEPQCPDHPLWTWRERDLSLRCSMAGCNWTSPAPPNRAERLRQLRLRHHQEDAEDALRAAGVSETFLPPTRARNN